MVLPISPREQDLSVGVRGAIYGAALVYFFVGVAMISTRFMNSIETVTSRRKRVHLKDGSGRRVTLKVWNDTVATLSLMALGSSAPEIALAVVDIFKWKFHFAPLGAATIVGSAAFNLLVIISVCIVVIPAGQGRQIKELPSFHITAAFSLFAYLWLVFILVVTSPNVVEIWEAILTFLFLPILIWVSYKVDIGDARKALVWLGLASEDSSAVREDSDRGYFVVDETLEVQGCLEDKSVDVVVTRTGHQGVASCSYATERFSAVPDFDFGDQSGTLEFSENDDRQTIRLEIKGRPEYKVDREFFLILSDASGSTIFNPETDGGEERAIMTVMIRRHTDTGGKKPHKVLRCLDGLVNISGIRHGNAEWLEQFCNAIYCNGSKELQKEATLVDWASHILALPWTMIFSFVPPTSYCGGWVCLFASLTFIAGLTIFISDLAELFGCVLGVPDYVTAITFVALGTSMPDLFASLTAAKEDPTADASIVNVTGSNSVNVFLGLGLPWTIAAFYWRSAGKTEDWTERYPDIAATRDTAVFVVSSQNLSFCVAVFSVTCLFSVGLLYFRRHWIGFELGGPAVAKYATSVTFLMLWFAFVGVASWSVLRGEESTLQEGVLVPGLSGIATFVAVLFTLVVIYASRGSQECCKGNGVTSYEEKDVFTAIPVTAVDEKESKPPLVRANSGVSGVSEGSSSSKKSSGNTKAVAKVVLI